MKTASTVCVVCSLAIVWKCIWGKIEHYFEMKSEIKFRKSVGEKSTLRKIK